MKLSKSILNPTGGGGPLSLPFLRLRLRRSTTATGNRKRGGGFENNNPEPSSPKVTCIGQVRVKKSKKKPNNKNQCRSLSGRRSGEVSFRKAEHPSGKNQRWVHLPASVCEALRSFGAEFSCLLFPCRIKYSSSSSCCRCNCRGVSNRETEDECGCSRDVVRRWLVFASCQGERRKEIEVVVGGRDEVRRHHVFEDIEVKDGRIQVNGRCLGEGEERGRVSICIPPKNALLLMRCRSDPTRMAALASRCQWECEVEDIQEEDDGTYDGEIVGFEGVILEEKINVECDEEEKLVVKEEEEEEEEEIESNMSSFEALLDHENSEDYDESSLSSSSAQSQGEGVVKAIDDVVTIETEESVSKMNMNNENDRNQEEEEEEKAEEEKNGATLPDCLVLMMCEPKLSMEVSKETWVRSTDFIRWPPPRRPVRSNGGCDHVRRKPAPPPQPVPSKPPCVPIAAAVGGRNESIQPPRSSCSLPAAAYEPFALTRCKSEPMRTAAAKLVPESCLNGAVKVEPMRRLGVGAAGAGC